MAGEIKRLETDKIHDAIMKFKSTAKTFTETKNKVEKTTHTLLSTWAGKSRNNFEKQYNLLTGNLNDIEETLYDLYDALVEAESTYIDADEAVSKEIDKNAADFHKAIAASQES